MARELSPSENARVLAAIRALLDRYKGNQSALAQRLGVKPSTINQCVSGKNGVSLATTKAVAKELRVHWAHLLTGTTTTASSDDALAETIHFAQKWLGIEQRAIDRVTALCYRGAPMTAKQLLEQLMAEQSRLHYEDTARTANTRTDTAVRDELDPPLPGDDT